MFKNMKKLIVLALPVVTLSLTSCGNQTRTIAYDQIRRYAEENYDQYALDSVPATYTFNFNKMVLDATLKYTTASGGQEAFNFSFGFGSTHVIIKDQYACCLSSNLIDLVEQYYSDFVGLAVTLQDRSPIQMLYQIFDGNCTKIDLTAGDNLVGSVLVKLLQLFSSVLDITSTVSGFLPIGQEPHTKVGQAILMGLSQVFEMMQLDSETQETIISVLFTIMDYLSLTVSDSSKSLGETFDVYATTNKYGFLNKFSFNFKSGFDIIGLAALKHYERDNPKEGDLPVSKDAPTSFTLTGSFDFDFNIVSEF